jgi:3-hydroxyisobutyrate dehydrogenase-like beta-hydroxyacid dehydrogenase
MKVGFIGLGRMGAGMATNLVKAGHEVTVFNRSRAKADDLVARDATAAATVAEACQGEVVMTMLANDEAVDSVVYGDGGVLASLAQGAIHISASTISVALSRRLSDSHAARRQRYVAAPVFGRPEVAAGGQLFVVAGGADDAIRDVASLFDAIGKQSFVMSETPSLANLVKLSGNFLIAAVIESLGEALALVGRAGIDPHQYIDLVTSTLFDAPVYRTYGNLIAAGQFEPAGFAASLGQKDIRLALAVAEELSVPLPLASLLRDRFQTLMAQGGETLDWSAIGQLPAKDAGARSCRSNAAR